MIINTNMSALNTIRQLSNNEKATSGSLSKLSSGLRINTAADDAAGLAISEKMRGQISGLSKASSNAQDAISLTATAEGALNETSSILQRMRELAVQSANDTNTSTDRGQIQKEVDQLAKEITRISNDTEFNTKSLLTGAASGATNALTFQIGANEDQTITLNIGAMDAKTLGVDNGAASGAAAVLSGSAVTTKAITTGGLDVTTQTAAGVAITAIDDALDTVSTERAKLGAYQNRLEHTINNLGTSAQNITSAEANIRDVDMAKEMTNFQKNNVLQQAAQAMLAQANQQTSQVLTLLR